MASQTGEGCRCKRRELGRRTSPRVRCEESHRFTAREKPTDRFQVICPKYADQPWNGTERLRKEVK